MNRLVTSWCEAFPSLLPQSRWGSRRSGYSPLLATSRIGDAADVAEECLIVQYGENDAPENHRYRENCDALRVSPRSSFEERLAKERRRTTYFPGRYTVALATARLGCLVGSACGGPPALDADEQAELFLHVIRTTALPPGVPIIAFDADGHRGGHDRFAEALRRLVSRSGSHDLRVLDVTFLQAEHFLPIDGHPNARGHARLAGELEKVLPASRAHFPRRQP